MTLTDKNAAVHNLTCPKALVQCSDCNGTFTRKDLASHSCVNYMKGMLEQCDAVFQQKERLMKDQWGKFDVS